MAQPILLLLAAPPLGVFAVAAAVFDAPPVLAGLLALLSAFVWSDAWYFIKMAIYQVHVLLLPEPSRPRLDLFDSHVRHDRVGLTDIDRNGHCNNARYLRECGFGRRDLWKANGVWAVVRSVGGNLVVAAQTVRYRRELSLGQAYALESRVLAWDDAAFYVEQRFVTTGADGKDFVHAIVYVKNHVLGSKRPADLVAAVAPGTMAPMIPDEIRLWNEANAICSAKLRPKKL
ncbi:hypothetical protein ACHHYP_05496 [Achlya hypogyna]|uniref:Uncharacterized protein n=1 Tax=Achlya hypogyna TaxID=1202772 RepID=A0A1V9YXP2_ACHHY|nr:hypothetical protein ACHHYP_05496 [Achlya hypogyna]